MKINSKSIQILADLTTPVSLFLKLRDQFAEILLLESSDYSSKEDSLSFLCVESLSSIELHQGQLKLNQTNRQFTDIRDELFQFIKSFEISGDQKSQQLNGVFGFSAYDLIQQFENIRFDADDPQLNVPELRYDFFRYLFVFDHFYDQLYLIENLPEGEESNLDKMHQLVYVKDHASYPFKTNAKEESNMTDTFFLDMVRKAKQHCQRGDVFQMVLSRRYQQGFQGDEFMVYRHLRSINPSPYLYYFDYGSFKIFGSSPEAQIKVENGHAEIHPIAGTFKRTGDFKTDQANAKKLLSDPKESAEHIMLVDLARNDLSKHATQVTVDYLKEVQYFSHVIHLVSKVTGEIKEANHGIQIFADTFPAGTLSGAPKYKAMELIDNYEPHRRGFYGGAIGMFTLDGDVNHAIIIRSFLSISNTLYFQAGAGIVINSEPDKELLEVENKLAALRRAINNAEKIEHE